MSKKPTQDFNVFNYWSGALQFTAKIECAPDEFPSVKLGLAVKWGFKNGAILDGARLVGAILDGASLDGASLDGARLDGASLDGASLVGARLVGARLDGASLDGARLDGASLYGRTLTAGTSWAALGFPDGWYAVTYNTKESGQRVHVGCQDKTIAEGREYWANKENRREVFAAMDYAEAIGKARGWIK